MLTSEGLHFACRRLIILLILGKYVDTLTNFMQTDWHHPAIAYGKIAVLILHKSTLFLYVLNAFQILHNNTGMNAYNGMLSN